MAYVELKKSNVTKMKTALKINKITPYVEKFTGKPGKYYECENGVKSIYKMFILDEANFAPMEIGNTYMVTGPALPVTSEYNGKLNTVMVINPKEIQG